MRDHLYIGTDLGKLLRIDGGSKCCQGDPLGIIIPKR
jgi:hypothetical protein